MSLSHVQLCNPMDCSLPDSSVHVILQAGKLEWVAISSREDLPKPGIKPRSPTLQADSLQAELPGKPHLQYRHFHFTEYEHFVIKNSKQCKSTVDLRKTPA